MLDNLLEFEVGLYEHSQAASLLPAGVLLDFANMFPSTSHELILRVLRRRVCPATLANLVSALYYKLRSTIIFSGTAVLRLSKHKRHQAGMPVVGCIICVGIGPTSSCPPRAGHFTERPHHRLRGRHRYSIALCALAKMPCILRMFVRSGRATGLCLKWCKCKLVWTKGEASDYAAAIREMPGREGLQLVLAATYLGFEVGPDAPRTQWDGVLQRIRRRAKDLMSVPPTLSKLLNYNIHIVSLVIYKAQVLPVPRHILFALAKVLQGTVKAPWQAMPTKFLENLRVLGFPVEARAPDRVGELRGGVSLRGPASEGLCSIASRLSPRRMTQADVCDLEVVVQALMQQVSSHEASRESAAKALEDSVQAFTQQILSHMESSMGGVRAGPMRHVAEQSCAGVAHSDVRDVSAGASDASKSGSQDGGTSGARTSDSSAGRSKGSSDAVRGQAVVRRGAAEGGCTVTSESKTSRSRASGSQSSSVAAARRSALWGAGVGASGAQRVQRRR